MLMSRIMKADGFDDCVLGAVESCNFDPVLVYDADKVVRKLMKRDKMTEEDAMEYFDYNIRGAYVGKGTPVYISHVGSNPTAATKYISTGSTLAMSGVSKRFASDQVPIETLAGGLKKLEHSTS